MSLLEIYHLKNNPFVIVPRSEPFWADRTKFKADLEAAIQFTLYGTQSQIIACIYGDWGCGKTHAMNYFSNENILTNMAEKSGITKEKIPFSIPIIFPTKEVFNTLYLDIVYKNLIPRLSLALNYLSQQSTATKTLAGQVMPLEKEGNLKKKINTIIGNDDLAKVLSQFNDRTKNLLVIRYLTKNAVRNDLSKLGIAKGIDTNSEMLTTLTDILKLFTRTCSSRIYIWIDDCERIEELPGREMFEFQYFLRDVLDLMPERLTFIVNFTLLPGMAIPERMTYLGPAVQNRIAKIINVSYFDEQNYLTYVEELIQNAKRVGDLGTQKYYPFTEKCLKNVFQMLEKSTSNLQPRTVNRVLSLLLESAVREKVSIIDEEYLDKLKTEIESAMTS
ncbi:MAG: P-loop NTPase fold protein [Candidatus Bathyarchaeia archaeon]|jgi:hypothetical protein